VLLIGREGRADAWQDSSTAERRAELIALRRQADDLAAAELPHGFGRN
jgi:hypothetical protein